LMIRHTEKKPGHNGVGVKTIILIDIAKGKFVQLRGITSTSGIDRKQYRPGNTTAGKADEDDNFEES
jgi:hypothetical protein